MDRSVSRHVPYFTNIYKYNLYAANQEDWMRYEALMDDVDFENTAKNMSVEEKLNKFYEILEMIVAAVFKKKDEYSDTPEKSNTSKNKIPKEIRLIMRQKAEISERITKCKDWSKKYRLEKELEAK